MPSAKDKALRRERILQFLRENHQDTPPQVQEKDENSLRQKKRVTFNQGKQQRSPENLLRVKENERIIGQGLTSCLITKSSDTRIPAGSKCYYLGSDIFRSLNIFNSRCKYSRENNPSVRKTGKLPRTDSECQFNSPGFNFLKTQKTEFFAQEIRLNPVKPIQKELKNKCDFFPKFVDNRPFKDQTTQTLYRESSAQTLAYFPEISNKENAETLELFSLAKLLPGEKPPGLHEVEILERARKRWVFQEAIKVNSKRLLNEAKSMALIPEFRHLVEAFEWELWIEREEYIQECQMLRLQIVIKMFDKRESEMHAASKIRIEQACEGIEKRRQAGRRKNEIEFQRGMRRLQIKYANTSKKWKKPSSMHALGSPCSEFYGPIIRHGVDPARRSYQPITERRAFDMRIDDLEKRVNMNKVQCPFSKLREWSKPKEYVREYEQNFCDDGNLQRLYESLKTLRTHEDFKEEPKCLKKRYKLADRPRFSSLSDGFDPRKFPRYSRPKNMPYLPAGSKLAKAKQLPIAPVRSNAKGNPELEHLIHSYEGTYIGSVMQFLLHEMVKLKEQRKLHYLSILAQRERWRREASEAGQRQKENDTRLLYEEIFQHSHARLLDISQQYIDTIMARDIDDIMGDKAAETVSEMARQIDEDIKRWLESFKLIQNPLNYIPLRQDLYNMVFPDPDEIIKRSERALIVKYIVEDVIFGRVWEELEPFDIATTLSSDFIDRLIDNDLYLFSTDSESELVQRTSWFEAEAIIRKLIRQAVPGRRWMEEEERIAAETYNDLFDDIFKEIIYKAENPPEVKPSDLIMVRRSTGMFMGSKLKKDKENITSHDSLQKSKLFNHQILDLVKKFKNDNVTKLLQTDETLNDSEHSNIVEHYIRKLHLIDKELAFSKPPPEPHVVPNIFQNVGLADEGCDERKSLNSNRVNPFSPQDEPVFAKQGEEEVRGQPAKPKEFIKEIIDDIENIKDRAVNYGLVTAKDEETYDGARDAEGNEDGEEELLEEDIDYSKNRATIFSLH
ncbi:hypothetical protein KR032_006139 [Drosophila birchii]|nr:hypothetical protein KR032_006139 [Drosophila birchii]